MVQDHTEFQVNMGYYDPVLKRSDRMKKTFKKMGGTTFKHSSCTPKAVPFFFETNAPRMFYQQGSYMNNLAYKFCIQTDSD